MATDFTRLWVDKHRPKKLDDLDFNPEVTEMLEKLAECQDLPHLIFYGPSGAGKKTRIISMLRKIYGQGLMKQSKETYVLKHNNKNLEIPLISSKYHIDVTPCDLKNNDKLIIQNLVKGTASSNQLSSDDQKSFKTIILNEADQLTHQA